MVKINSDSKGILSINLETDPNDGVSRTVVIKSKGRIYFFLHNIVGNMVETGDYLYLFEDSDEDYTILVYNQDVPVDYSPGNYQQDNFPLDKAVQGFELMAALHFSGFCRICGSNDMELSTCRKCDSKTIIQPGNALSYDNYGGSYYTYRESPNDKPTLRNRNNTSRNQQQVTFREDSDLSDKERKYCSCILKVGAKGGVRNKYAVCAASVGTTSRRYRENYDMESMPEVYRQEILEKDKH